MEKEFKYCSKCGSKQDLGTKFCTNCGNNFEEKELKDIAEEENQTGESILSKVNLDKLDWNKLKSNKGFLLSVGVIFLLLFSYLFIGKSDIAGSYYSEYTEDIMVDISRNGVLTLTAADEEVNLEYSFKLKKVENELESVYYPDYSKGFNLEIRIPEYLAYQDPEFQMGVKMITSMTGLKEKTQNGQLILSGKLKADEIMVLNEFDLDEITVVEITQDESTDSIYIDNELFIKR